MVDEAHLDELRQLRLVRALAVGIQENWLEAIRLREAHEGEPEGIGRLSTARVSAAPLDGGCAADTQRHH